MVQALATHLLGAALRAAPHNIPIQNVVDGLALRRLVYQPTIAIGL